MEELHLIATDGYSLNVHVFKVEKPIGFIQVVHGMEEHQRRYESLVKKLNEIGFTVVTSDLRGHGPDAPTLGFFAEKDGYKLLIEDQKIISKYIRDELKADKIIMYAHSMGTIITRNLLMSESNGYEKVILSGYPNPDPGAILAIIPTSIVKKLRGAEYFSKTLEGALMSQFSSSVEEPKTDVDWLSYNEENIQNYLNDPLCGKGFKVSALEDLFKLVKNMANAGNYENINKELPILMLRGDADPCTGGDKGSEKSISVLKKAGFENISEIKYEHMRHEIINEDLNKVFLDIKLFLTK